MNGRTILLWEESCIHHAVWIETVEIFIILNAELFGNTEQNADIFILDNFVFFAPCADKNFKETKPPPLLQNLTYDDENSTSGWFRVWDGLIRWTKIWKLPTYCKRILIGFSSKFNEKKLTMNFRSNERDRMLERVSVSPQPYSYLKGSQNHILKN